MLERELKLLVTRKDLSKVFRLRTMTDALRAAPQRRLMRCSYHDTPEHDLRKHGIELRILRVGREWIQTMKVLDDGLIGPYSPTEFECPVASGQPDFAPLAEAGAPPALLAPEIQSRVMEIFEIRFWRRKGVLEFTNGAMIEICADSGSVIAGEESATICEVNLELKRGLPDSLHEVANELASKIDVQLNLLSKPDLGYHLIEGFEPKPVFAKKTKLSGGRTVEEVFARLLTESVEHAFANEEAVLESSDIEGVHQMRVGLRRFRSVLSVFKPIIPEDCCNVAKEKARPLLAALGPARDWDVFVTEQIAALRRSMPDWEHFADLERVAETLRARAYQGLRELLRSRAYHQAKLTLVSWIACHGWRASMTSEELAGLKRPADEFVKLALQQGHQRIRKRGRGIRRKKVDELHRLRIATKRQRYSVEFFGSLFPAKKVRGYRSSLKVMQRDLGRLNDSATAKRLLEEIRRIQGMQDSVQFVLGWTARGCGDSHEHLKDVWKSFKNRRSFWKKPRKRKQTDSAKMAVRAINA